MKTGRRRVAVLGSTGSIGRQALEVAAAHPDALEVVSLVAGSDAETLEAQVRATGAAHHGLGARAAVEAASHLGVDVVLNAIVGCAGLEASVAALRAGKTLALANKESLVAGGRACLGAAAEGGGRLVPVDSEHAALAQCLARCDRAEVARITLTASGGPFRTRSDLSSVTRDEALAHPTWSMGPKITVDSATLMNKGLEVIEAHWLFGLRYDAIGVLVHPQSIVHGIVEMNDGSVLMQAAPADMKIPIQAALLAEERVDAGCARLDLAAAAPLEFEEVDHDRFPSLGLAYGAGRAGGTAPAVLNAANEVAVGAFLDGGLPFAAIPEVVRRVLDEHEPGDDSSVEQVLAADRWARQEASRSIAGVAA
ncbi:MAG TPA: 1-deoxy-D-xylulose-5-phosphate reductoisomerase [Actinomycetota bacterium]|nr:1-deoxy-D-xylulose-5-phosphate reductoisomerase [Actinomycetota bacterium]